MFLGGVRWAPRLGGQLTRAGWLWGVQAVLVVADGAGHGCAPRPLQERRLRVCTRVCVIDLSISVVVVLDHESSMKQSVQCPTSEQVDTVDTTVMLSTINRCEPKTCSAMSCCEDQRRLKTYSFSVRVCCQEKNENFFTVTIPSADDKAVELGEIHPFHHLNVHPSTNYPLVDILKSLRCC
eukprot:2107661-Amphidinium_carterae.1